MSKLDKVRQVDKATRTLRVVNHDVNWAAITRWIMFALVSIVSIIVLGR
jgi:hypothetical protein